MRTVAAEWQKRASRKGDAQDARKDLDFLAASLACYAALLLAVLARKLFAGDALKGGHWNARERNWFRGGRLRGGGQEERRGRAEHKGQAPGARDERC